MIKKNKKALIIATLVVFLFVLGLVWLSIVTLLFVFIYNIAFRFIPLVRHTFLRKMVKGIFLFMFLLSTSICIKLLVFDIYKIPSSSMQNLLYPGDIVVVNKLNYGPKLPSSPFEIPWINLAFYMNTAARLRIKETWWDYRRLDGTERIKRGDVFVFALYGNQDFFVIKRCVGLPGDTLIIKNSEIFANSILFRSPSTVKGNYQFRIKDRKHFYERMDSLMIYEKVTHDNNKVNFGRASFSKKDLALLKKSNSIDSIKKIADVFDNSKSELLKTSTSKWTLDNMGPIIIPKKGMQINLNLDNCMLYEKVMTEYEKNIVVKKKDTYFVNGKRAVNYIFKQNYYFMMGDNRKETIDSRFWGFLPESYIVGKVQCILISNKDNQFQWDRLFKVL